MLKIVSMSVLAVSLFGGATLGQAWAWWRGDDAFTRGEFGEATKLYHKGLGAEGDGEVQAQLAFNKGNAQYRQEQYEAAEEAFTQAFEQDPALWKALYNQGNARFFQDDLEGAIESYEAALEIEPTDEDTIHNLEYVRNLLKKKQEEQQKQDPSKKQQEQGGKNDPNQQGQGDQDQDSESGDQGEQEQGGEQSEDKDGDGKPDNQEGDETKEGEDGKNESDGKNDGDPKQGDQGQEFSDEIPMPDRSYSDQVLERLQQEENEYQQFHARQQGQNPGDPMELWNQVFKDPSELFFGGDRKDRRSDDEVDW